MEQQDTSFIHFLKPEADGLICREAGPWVEEKLYYIQRYLDVFITSMRKKAWRSIRYIDLFSGPGKCQIKGTNKVVLGSPLLALTANFPFTEYVFSEASLPIYEALRTRCQAFTGDAQIHSLLGDGNTIVDEVVDRIQTYDQKFIRGQWPSLNFAFLDPEGLELNWQTIEKLGQVQKMDLIFYYSQGGITRNLENYDDSEKETSIDKFFGDRQWRVIYRDGKNKGYNNGRIHRDLLDYFKSKLSKLGYVDVFEGDTNAEPLIRNTQKNAPMYRLIFASKHPLGHKFWNQINQKDVYGQQRLL